MSSKDIFIKIASQGNFTIIGADKANKIGDIVAENISFGAGRQVDYVSSEQRKAQTAYLTNLRVTRKTDVSSPGWFNAASSDAAYAEVVITCGNFVGTADKKVFNPTDTITLKNVYVVDYACHLAEGTEDIVLDFEELSFLHQAYDKDNKPAAKDDKKLSIVKAA